jgi:two-component system sensor histidine kinase YesM
MKFNLSNLHFTIFPKLVAAFLIVMIPMYALSQHMNEQGADSVREELSKSLQSQVHFYISQLEMELDRIIKLQREFVNDEDLISLSLAAAGLSDYERTQAIKRLQRRLNIIKSSSNIIKEVSAHIPAIQRTISTSELIKGIPEQEFKILQTIAERPGSPIIYWKGRLFLSEPFPNPPVTGKKQPLFILGIELSTGNMLRTLENFSNYQSGGAALINTDWLIVNDRDRQIVSDAVSRLRNEQMNQSANGLITVQTDERSYLATYEASPLIDTTLLIFVPEEQVLGKLQTYRNRFWILSAISVFIILVFSYWIYRLIHRPLRHLIHAFRKVEKGNLDIVIHHRSRDEFNYLYKHFNFMVQRLNILIKEIYEQKLRAQRSELKQLQSQINPHFLYNSFFALKRMARNHDTENVERFANHLEKYFQFITRNRQDEIPLEAEVNHARAYTEIQNVRFSNRIKVEFQELPEGIRNVRVPRLILQPLIENAFQHGLEQKVTEGKLLVGFMEDGQNLFIYVEDNGEHLKDEDIQKLQKSLQAVDEDMESTALINIHRRLKLKFGAPSGISLMKGKWGGLRVNMRIPLKGEK